MNQPTHNEAIELANVRLLLRRGLVFELHEFGGQPTYVVKDPTSSGFFQLGLAEYAFVSLLDGRTTLQEAVQETAHKLGEDAFSVRDAIGTCHWLLQNGLAEPVSSTGHVGLTNIGHLLKQQSDRQNQKRLAQTNPLFIKLPLGDPEPLIRAIAPLFSWIASKAFFVLWCITTLVALSCLFQSGSDLAKASQAIFTPNAWWWLIATFVIMKIFHEFAHGLFCTSFGGRVPETGLVFILFMPIPYVDVSSCWGFESKWRRIAVSFAGMYVELFLAGAATIAWTLTHDPVAKFHLFNVMLTGSLTTVLFNANFLMRFDGYYILSDLIEIPNLAQSGQQYLQYIGKRYLLGMEVNAPRHGLGYGLAIKCYGVAAFIWRIFIYVSLAILATALLYGFGVALAILGIAMWIGMPAFRFAKLILGKSVGARPSLKRFALATVPIIAATIAIFFVVPWPIQVSAPAIVKYHDPAIVRAEAAGFVREIKTQNGVQVQQGDVLLVLENHELETRLIALEAEHQASLIRSRRHHSDREIASYQSEVATRLAIEKQVAELQRQVGQLIVRASATGKIVSVDLEQKLRQHVALGTELFKIVNEEEKEIVVSVSQDDFDTFLATVGKPVVFSPKDSLSRPAGELSVVEPTATNSIDIRLASYSGGPLAVRPSANKSTTQKDSIELIHPRFQAIVALPSPQNIDIKTGSIGHVRLNRYSESIAVHLIKNTRTWIKNCFDAAKQDLPK